MNKIIKKLKNNPRVIIFGKTGSGKTWLLMNKIVPLLKCKIDEWIIFTREENENYYLHNLTKITKKIPHIYTDKERDLIDDIPDIISKILKLQRENVAYYKKDGEAVYKTNICFIFDDIIDDKLFNNRDFKKIFFNSRKMQVTTILTSQTSTRDVNTALKGNTDIFIIFKLNNKFQRNFAIDEIKECMYNNDIYANDKDTHMKAKQLFFKKAQQKQYGYIIIDDDGNIF